jgi:hypothetical protein
MNVIDQLVVTLGLDNSGFKRGTEEAGKVQDGFVDQSRRQNAELDDLNKKSAQAQSDRAKELNARAKTAAESFAKIRNQALSLFAVFTAGKGVSNFTSDTISSTAALGLLAENTGVAESKLAALNLMAKNAGGSAEEMMGAVVRAAKVVADFQQLGMRSEEVASFFQWGGTNEGLQDTESYLLAVSAILKKAVEERGELAALSIAQRMGFGRNMFNVLKVGPEALSAQIAASEKLTGINEKQAQQAQMLFEKWNNLKASFESTGREILFNLTPYLDKLIAKLNEFSAWVKSDQFKKWLEESAEAVKNFTSHADEFVQTIGGWKNVLAGLLALKAAEFVAPLLLLTGALTGVSTALLAVSAAAATGYGIGKYIDEMLPDTTKGAIGEWVARFMATFGSEEAKKALIDSGAAPQSSIFDVYDDVMQGAKEKYGRFKEGLSGQKEQIAIDFFKGKGWTQEQAIGIVANFKAESGLKTDAVGDGGQAYGIAQWHPDRQERFKQWAGHDIRRSSLNEQLAFAQYELETTEKAAAVKIRAAKTAAEATNAAQIHYERPDPKNRASDTEKRQTIAYQMEGRQTAKAPDIKASDTKTGPAKEGAQRPDAQSIGLLKAPLVIQSPVRQAMSAKHSTISTTHNSPVSNSSTSETKIGQIVIHTPATDPKRIAAEIPAAIERRTQTFNAASGMRQ